VFWKDIFIPIFPLKNKHFLKLKKMERRRNVVISIVDDIVKLEKDDSQVFHIEEEEEEEEQMEEETEKYDYISESTDEETEKKKKKKLSSKTGGSKRAPRKSSSKTTGTKRKREKSDKDKKPKKKSKLSLIELSEENKNFIKDFKVEKNSEYQFCCDSCSMKDLKEAIKAKDTKLIKMLFEDKRLNVKSQYNYKTRDSTDDQRTAYDIAILEDFDILKKLKKYESNFTI
jgi:hypothetical protein